MRKKITTHKNDSNFLTQDLWSKTRLGMQHIHLELMQLQKNKHNSRINIFDTYKIVINSPELHFGIKRQHVEVGVVWTSLGPLPRWVPGPTTRWAPGTTWLALHGT
jgi:hypothetical protein